MISTKLLIAVVLLLMWSSGQCQQNIPGCPTRIDLAIVMDQSSSITWVEEKNWEIMKNFVINLVSAYPISPSLTRVGLVKFSDEASLTFNLAAYSSVRQVISAINNTRHQGGLTNLADALRVTRTQLFNAPGDRPQVKNICIFITDGHATVDPGLVTSEALLAQEEAEIFTIGITNDVNQIELETIANDPDSLHTFLVDDFNLLQTILADVIRETCAVVTTIEPPQVATTSLPVIRCPQPVDLGIVMDSSGSITYSDEGNWDLMKDFVIGLTDAFTISRTDTRVGLIQFSDNARTIFPNLNATSKSELQSAIRSFGPPDGFTNTPAALRALRTQIFSTEGDRPEVKNIAIIITDGRNTENPQLLINEARAVLQSDIEVFAVGIGDDIDGDELELIATDPDFQHVFRVQQFLELIQILNFVIDRLCQAIPTPEPTDFPPRTPPTPFPTPRTPGPTPPTPFPTPRTPEPTPPTPFPTPPSFPTPRTPGPTPPTPFPTPRTPDPTPPTPFPTPRTPDPTPPTPFPTPRTPDPTPPTPFPTPRTPGPTPPTPFPTPRTPGPTPPTPFPTPRTPGPTPPTPFPTPRTPDPSPPTPFPTPSTPSPTPPTPFPTPAPTPPTPPRTPPTPFPTPETPGPPTPDPGVTTPGIPGSTQDQGVNTPTPQTLPPPMPIPPTPGDPGKTVQPPTFPTAAPSPPTLAPGISTFAPEPAPSTTPRPPQTPPKPPTPPTPSTPSILTPTPAPPSPFPTPSTPGPTSSTPRPLEPTPPSPRTPVPTPPTPATPPPPRTPPPTPPPPRTPPPTPPPPRTPPPTPPPPRTPPPTPPPPRTPPPTPPPPRTPPPTPPPPRTPPPTPPPPRTPPPTPPPPRTPPPTPPPPRTPPPTPPPPRTPPPTPPPPRTPPPTPPPPETPPPTPAPPRTPPPTPAPPRTPPPTPPPPRTPPPTPPPPRTPPPRTPEPTLPPGFSTTFAGCTRGDVDVVFILDASGSIGEDNFRRLRQFVTDVVRQLDVESGRVRIGAITFDDTYKLQFRLNDFNNTQDLLKAIDGIIYTYGSTNTADALRYVQDVMFTQSFGDRPNVKNMAIIITDGESNSPETTMRESRRMRTQDIHMVSIGIGNWLNQYELIAMASYPVERNRLQVENFGSISNIIGTIQEAICDNNDDCRGNPCRNGNCRDSVGYYYCECFTGYGGRNCEKRCERGADVILALDASGSIGPQNFQRMIEQVADLIFELDLDNGNDTIRGTRLGIATFSDQTEVVHHLNEYVGRMSALNALDILYKGGTTNTASVIRYARETMFQGDRGDRPQVDNYLVIFTDGRSNDGEATWDEALKARAAGIKILAVGIGDGISRFELQGMASPPIERNTILIRDFRSLSNILGRIADGVCNNEDACLSNPCQNDAQCRDGFNGYDCGPCPEGFTGAQCERGCNGAIDLMFLIDSSGSIRWERFPFLLGLISNITMRMDVSPTTTRIGAVYWSNSGYIAFHLNQYQTREDVIHALYQIPFIGDRTNTTAALELARLTMFTPMNNDRQDAPNIAIILTDGNSNIRAEQTIPEAIKGRVAGTQFIVVAIGSDVTPLELRGLASEPKEQNIFSIPREAELLSYVDSIVQMTCNDRDDCEPDPCNGQTCRDLNGRYSCVCQLASGKDCSESCPQQLDIAFILDVSGSVESEYEMTIEFAREVVQGLDMSVGRSQVGAIAFSSEVVDYFPLNRYTDKESVLTALYFFHQLGRTNAQAGLRTMRTDVFSLSGGDRFGIPNIAIFVSDGNSNVNEFNTIPEANRAKDQDIEIITVAIGENVNLIELEQIASEVDSDHIYRLERTEEIGTVARRLLDYVCQVSN